MRASTGAVIFYNDVFVWLVLVQNIMIIEQFENLIP